MEKTQPDPDPVPLSSQVPAALRQAVLLEQSAISQEIRHQTEDLLAYLAVELEMLQKNVQALNELRARIRLQSPGTHH